MEIEGIKQYLINFVEKTLNECEVFARGYGEDFVRKRLETNLPILYKKNWFQKLKETIKSKFIQWLNQDIRHNTTLDQNRKINQQQFKAYISDMSNYSAKSSKTNKTTQLAEQKQPNELGL